MTQAGAIAAEPHFQTSSTLPKRRVSVERSLWDANDPLAPNQVIVPADWSDAAARAFARIACFKGRLPKCLKPIGATNVPEFLWRSGLDRQALRDAPREDRYSYEHDAFAVAARIAGGTAYWGWRLGYFETPEAALAFHDGYENLILTRRLLPEQKLWASMGLHWAYGINDAETSYSSGYGLSTDQQQIDRLETLIERPDLGSLAHGIVPETLVDAGGEPEKAQQVLAEASLNDWQSLSGLVGGSTLARVISDLTAAIARSEAQSLETMLQDPEVAAAAIEARQAGLPDTMIARAAQLRLEGRLDRLKAWMEQCARRQDLSNEPRARTMLALSDGLLELALEATEAQAEGEKPLLDSASADAVSLMDSLAWAGWTTGQPGICFSDNLQGWSGLGEATLDEMTLANVGLPRLNLMPERFLLEGNDPDAAAEFDTAGFVEASRIGLTALDISLSVQHWPEEPAAMIARDHRPVGLGLGALSPLLERLGLAYDSDAARATAAGLSALVSAIAVGSSAELTQRLGPCPAYASSADAMRASLGNRALAAAGANAGYQGLSILPIPFEADACAIASVAEAVANAWQDALAMVENCGLRNHVTTSFGAPGPAGLIADSYQPTLSPARAYMDETPSGAAQIGMMAACQPYLSGSIAMTVALPPETSLAETANLILMAWRRGLKQISLFRTAGPSDQPWRLPVQLAEAPERAQPAQPAAVAVDEPMASAPAAKADDRGKRHTMPSRRKGYTQKATVGGHKIYLRTGEYEDGSLGEIFIDMHKEGAAFRSLMNNFAVAISIGLQYGVPLEEFVEAFTFTRFDPAGPVEGNEAVKMATSVLDYMFRELAISYLGRDDLAHARPEDMRHDSLGTGDRQGDLPEAPSAADLLRRLASSGYLRDQLHHGVKSGETGETGSRISRAMAMGFLAEPCAHCGNLTLMQSETGTACRTCGASHGQFSDADLDESLV
jgi:hypothetical protein